MRQSCVTQLFNDCAVEDKVAAAFSSTEVVMKCVLIIVYIVTVIGCI